MKEMPPKKEKKERKIIPMPKGIDREKRLDRIRIKQNRQKCSQESGGMGEIDSLFSKALRLSATLHFEEARDIYLKIIELRPDYTEGYYNLGLVYDELNQTDKAIDCYLEAIKLNPNYTDAYYNVGVTFFEQQDFGQAFKYLTFDTDGENPWRRRALEIIDEIKDKFKRE